MNILEKIKSNYALLVILILAAALRFYKADYQNLWLDEVLTMNASDPSLSLKQFYDHVLFWEYIPHLYFFLNRLLFEVFGFTSLVARIFSGIIGVAGVYAIYLLGEKLHNKKAGLLAALLLAVNIFHISYSQEIRPYGLLLLFTVISFYRLLIFVRDTSTYNAIIYGIFTGLIVNAHFFGFITIFSQCIILLYIFVFTSKNQKLQYFKSCLIAGGSALLIMLPAYKAIIRVSNVDSFWAPKPGADFVTQLIKEFFGSSEMVLFLLYIVAIYYFINLFRLKEESSGSLQITNNKFLFSFILLFTWIFVSLAIPLIKSYLDVPMTLSRYFINILPAFLLIIAIGIALIRNRTIIAVLTATIMLVSLFDIYIAKDYYGTVRKTQYREITNDIKAKNTENIKIVTFYSWIFSHFFKDVPSANIVTMNFDDYVNAMREGTMGIESFWYADANVRPYSVTAENQQFLEQNFTLRHKLEYFDTWANCYISKTIATNKAGVESDNLDLNLFKPKNIHDGKLMFFSNESARYPLIPLDKGKYNLVINAVSTPAQPVMGENAHLIIKINGRDAGDFFLSTKNEDHIVPFTVARKGDVRIQIIYDNDILVDGKDRNAAINTIKIKSAE